MINNFKIKVSLLSAVIILTSPIVSHGYDKNILRIYLSNYDDNCKEKNILENFMVKIRVI